MFQIVSTLFSSLQPLTRSLGAESVVRDELCRELHVDLDRAGDLENFLSDQKLTCPKPDFSTFGFL